MLSAQRWTASGRSASERPRREAAAPGGARHRGGSWAETGSPGRSTTRCSSRPAGTRRRRPWRRTGSTRCWAIRSAGSPAASWRRGTGAACAPAAVIAFGRAAGPTSRPSAQAGVSRKNRSRDRRCLVCRIPGFERPVGTSDLCLSCDGLRRRRRQSVAAYVGGDGEYPAAVPRPGLGTCTVASCQRLAARPQTGLCGAHDGAWRLAGRPELAIFRRSAAPCLGDRSGRVVLAGLEENVIAELLYGVQAALAEGRRVMPATLRHVAAHLRRSGAGSVADAASLAAARTPVRWFLAFTADRVALVRSSLETEQAKDVWDLRLWGAAGRLSFTGPASHRHAGGRPTRPITQPWLKAAAKAWAAEALTTKTAGPVRAVIVAVGLLSEHLARRADAGTDPASLGHRDVEAFLARLAHLERAGTLPAGVRVRSLNLVASFLRDCREMGLTQPGAVLAGLPGDVVIRRAERPRGPRRDDEAGRALPETVMSQLLDPGSLERLSRLAGPHHQSGRRARRRRGPAHRRAVLAALRLPGLRRAHRRRRRAPGQPGARARHAQGRQDRLPAAGPRPGSGHHHRPASPGPGRLPRHAPRTPGAVPAAAEEPRRHQAHRGRAPAARHASLGHRPASPGRPRARRRRLPPAVPPRAGVPLRVPAQLRPAPRRRRHPRRHAQGATRSRHGPHHARVLPGDRQTQAGRPGPARAAADRRPRAPGAPRRDRPDRHRGSPRPDRAGRGAVRDLHRAGQRRRGRALLPVPAPLHRLHLLPHRSLLHPRAAGLPRPAARRPGTPRHRHPGPRRLGPPRRRPLRRGDRRRAPAAAGQRRGPRRPRRRRPRRRRNGHHHHPHAAGATRGDLPRRSSPAWSARTRRSSSPPSNWPPVPEPAMAENNRPSTPGGWPRFAGSTPPTRPAGCWPLSTRPSAPASR